MLTNSNPQSILVMLCLYIAVASVAGLYQRFIFPGYNLFASLFSGIHQICIPAFPFDPPTQSGTLLSYTTWWNTVITGTSNQK